MYLKINEDVMNIRDDGVEMSRRKNDRKVYQRAMSNSARVQFRFEMEMQEAGDSCKKKIRVIGQCVRLLCRQCGRKVDKSPCYGQREEW